MRHDLVDAPEVRRIGRACGLDRDQVVGKLHRLWSWADRHGRGGVVDADVGDVDEQVGHPGFTAALVSVGWLGGTEGGIVIPHWDRHNSESAKERALSATRQERFRGPKHENLPRNGTTVTPSNAGTVTRLEEINPPPPPREAVEGDTAALRSAWEAAARKGHVQAWNASELPDKAAARLAEPGWLSEALRAIEHLPRCRYFDKGKATLIQLCVAGFVGRVLGGQYDTAKQVAKPSGHPNDRPSASDAAAAWQRAADDPEAARLRQEYLDAKKRKAAAAAGGAA